MQININGPVRPESIMLIHQFNCWPTGHFPRHMQATRDTALILMQSSIITVLPATFSLTILIFNLLPATSDLYATPPSTQAFPTVVAFLLPVPRTPYCKPRT